MSGPAGEAPLGDPAAAAGSSLEVRGISHGFVQPDGGRLDVLDGIDLKVEPGEFAALIGPSGCGKSTLFNLVAGLDRPDAGAVLVGGAAVTGRGERVAYMPQKDLLLPWRRIEDNAALGLEVGGMPRKQARERVRPLFAEFGLAGFERSYPAQLSGGMRQRVALLRTVAMGRPVLLLDEPLGALDSLTRTQMQLWLAEVCQRHGWTILLVTHDIREAVLLADRIHVLSPRPARVVARVTVDLPRPRTAATLEAPRFAQLERDVLRALGVTGAGGVPGSVGTDDGARQSADASRPGAL